MSKYITAIRTSEGDMQIDYNALANLPSIPNIAPLTTRISTAEANISTAQTDINDLEGRISDVENALGSDSTEGDLSTLTSTVNTLKTTVSDHTADTTKHITAAERTAWNAKAPAIKCGSSAPSASDFTEDLQLFVVIEIE